MYDSITSVKQVVGSMMSAPAITINQADSVGSALCLMRRRQVQRLPVVDDAGQLRGMLTYGDIRRLKALRILQLNVPAIADVLHRIVVHEVMTRQPFAVSPETRLIEACQMMVEHKISGLPIVDTAGAVVGMVTERDVFEALVRQHDRASYTPRTSCHSPFALEPQAAPEECAVV